jgi:hypothetical protein
MLIAIASLTASPGATTAAVALSAHWPEAGTRPTVVECDPYGGALALRHGLRLQPGLSDVAAALASGTCDPSKALAEGEQTLDLSGTHIPVVVTGPGGDETRSALPVLNTSGAKVLNPPASVVLADIGRLDLASVAWPVAADADLVVCVIEGTLSGVAHLKFSLEKVRLLEALGVRVALAVRQIDYSAAEVTDAFRAQGLDLTVLGPLGPAAAGATRRRLRRRSRSTDRWTALAEAVRATAESRPLALPAGESASPKQEEGS